MRLTKLCPLACVAGVVLGCEGSPGLGPDSGSKEPAAATVSALATSNTWSTKAPMPFGRSFLGAAASNGILYAVGGGIAVYGSQGVIAGQLYVYVPAGALLRYDPATNTWTKRAPPPRVHGESAGAGVIGGKLYIAGGAFQYAAIANVYAYDPVTNAWSARAPMPTALNTMASAVIDKKLYVAGGAGCSACEGGRTLYVYDPATNSWTEKRPLPTGRTAAAGAVAQGKLYVVGGFTDLQYGIARVDAYTP